MIFLKRLSISNGSVLPAVEPKLAKSLLISFCAGYHSVLYRFASRNSEQTLLLVSPRFFSLSDSPWCTFVPVIG